MLPFKVPEERSVQRSEDESSLALILVCQEGILFHFVRCFALFLNKLSGRAWLAHLPTAQPRTITAFAVIVSVCSSKDSPVPEFSSPVHYGFPEANKFDYRTIDTLKFCSLHCRFVSKTRAASHHYVFFSHARGVLCTCWDRS